MTSAPAIGFEYRPSRWAARLFVAVGLLALLAVALSGLPKAAQFLVALGVVGACWRAMRTLRLPVNAVGWAPQRGWSLRGSDGSDEPATLRSHKVIGTLVSLRLASRRYGKLTLWLMPDNSDTDIRRRLRMRLVTLSAAEEAAA